jgi:pimeloyl-ACP methyl ester carboxylesterase
MDRKAWDGLARALASGGINVLALDYRGFGESGGPRAETVDAAERQQTVTNLWPGDIDAAFQYLGSHPGVQRDRLGAGGASCGVNQSVKLAQRHPEVKSLVLLSGGTDRAGRRYLRQSKVAILASGADDDGGIVEIMQWLVAPAPNPANRFIRYTAGGHGAEMFRPHADLITNIVDWYRVTLAASKTGVTTAASKSIAGTRPTASPFLEAIDEPDNLARAKKLFSDAQAQGKLPAGYDEAIVNQLAYERLADNDFNGAVELAKMNVTAFPKSANAYDSLGDAYLAAGNTDAARENAQKALELLSADTTMAADRKKAIRESAEAKLKPKQ